TVLSPCIARWDMVDFFLCGRTAAAQTSAVFDNPAILLTNRWSTRWEPTERPALASPPVWLWDPKTGAEAPRVNSGFSKALERHRRRFFCAPSCPPGGRTGVIFRERLRAMARKGKSERIA